MGKIIVLSLIFVNSIINLNYLSHISIIKSK
jgi:hypothetical protein